MDQPIASSSRQTVPPTGPPTEPNGHGDQYARLSFQPASQAQILRAHQRDTSQIYRLTDLVSEILRSIAGTRWLAHKQTIIDLLVKAVYLTLTFGRGSQTLGEEYTDILPFSTRRGRAPSKKRRLFTILFLLAPSLLNSPTTTAYLRNNTSDSTPSTRLQSVQAKLLRFLESPLGKSLPEVHMIAFLFGGRFFEFGRRLTGVSYISTLPATPPERRAPSYEPLGLLMLLPFLYRFLPSRRESSQESSVIGADRHPALSSNQEKNDTLPLSAPFITPEQTLLLTKDGTTYDQLNTYLSNDALDLPERQCTLCLEPRGTGEGSGGTVAVTECGHVFCWGCLGGLEKLECPLCRQTLRMERLVAAYNL
ncbi:hypothetical protein CI109_101208 [Kwoniella shandongensis]|uniref:RING-type E3 ubiquitin transferase n=1 Tax=Kwoniella shandongensis TaxID=1734106 RepID=A0A5M6BTL5_9TREE|nr:uncharacterized protein CI109_005474 [Kwoniella shandongensis]KAA5526196.1 hypothetical protein CI109_005474 [Kwoniella shandongensis]